MVERPERSTEFNEQSSYRPLCISVPSVATAPPSTARTQSSEEFASGLSDLGTPPLWRQSFAEAPWPPVCNPICQNYQASRGEESSCRHPIHQSALVGPEQEVFVFSLLDYSLLCVGIGPSSIADTGRPLGTPQHLGALAQSVATLEEDQLLEPADRIGVVICFESGGCVQPGPGCRLLRVPACRRGGHTS
jgi:hypothetical protein